MRIHHDIKPVTYMKTRAAQLLRSVAETRRPVVITQNGEPKGVLLDFNTYQELREAILLLKAIAQGEEDIRARRTVTQDQLFADLRRLLPK